jgi:hypothetical protein
MPSWVTKVRLLSAVVLFQIKVCSPNRSIGVTFLVQFKKPARGDMNRHLQQNCYGSRSHCDTA